MVREIRITAQQPPSIFHVPFATENQYQTALYIEQNVHTTIIINNIALKKLELNIFCFRDCLVHLKMFIKNALDCQLNIYLQEPGAQFFMKGAYVLEHEEKVSIVANQFHQAPQTTSSLLMKGVLDDISTSFFSGKILVSPDAFLTNAQLYNKNILLSQGANSISLPTLEVLTDNVRCSHGTATGFIDQEQLFYLEARGLSFENAKKLLLDAFLQEVF